jgi:hypothetical protein
LTKFDSQERHVFLHQGFVSEIAAACVWPHAVLPSHVFPRPSQFSYRCLLTAAAAYMQAMSKAFGRPVDEVFSQLSSKPVAAASLGQVYRGKLKPEFGGREVAVKVQRPDVLEQVCLDLYLMRQAAEALSALPEVSNGGALFAAGELLCCVSGMQGVCGTGLMKSSVLALRLLSSWLSAGAVGGVCKGTFQI